MDKPIIYMDMDGVVADFDKGYRNAFNRDVYADDGLTITQFCLQIPHFFRMLPVNEKGVELLELLKDDYNIKFLTTPMKEMNFCKRDKIIWLRENIGNYDIFFSHDKAEYVIDDKSILIDDMEHNLLSWREAGGMAIRYPDKTDNIIKKINNVFNSVEEVKKVKKQIKEMKVNTNPTENQKLSGIYKKGDIDFKGLKIKIENPKGSYRFGFDEFGKKWCNKLHCHYGYITGTKGSDNDPVDCYLGDNLNKSLAFIINQGKGGMFDEHKIMLGCESLEEAEKLYLSNYQKGWEKNIMSISQINTKKLRDWLEHGNMTEPYEI